MFLKTKNNEKKYLILIIFSHFFSCCFSSFYDKISHSEVRLTSPSYWFWFFTYWSAWTSLLTIPWAIYRLCYQKKKKETWGWQLIDMVVVETNLISGVVFCAGGFWLTFPKKNPWQMVDYLPFSLIFRRSVYKIFPWLLYNFFWHVWSPFLVICFWWKYCLVNLLVKKKSVFANLINPTSYFIYLLTRPQVPAIKWGKVGKEPFEYPYDYPYPPFYWCMGKKAVKDDNHFWLRGQWVEKIWPVRLLWITITVTFWYLIFSLLLTLLIIIKIAKEKKFSLRETFKDLLILSN